MIYFDSKKLPAESDEYVCFIDIMGIQNTMEASLPTASNYIFKLHAVLLEQWRTHPSFFGLSIYPIMDGAYISSRRKEDILQFLASVYFSLAKNLLNDSYKHWFFIRGGLAFGSVTHGRSIPYEAVSQEFPSRVGYKESILIGRPVISAFKAEKQAAPMGIYIDESCTNKAYPIPSDWKWYALKPEFDSIGFKQKLNEYYLYRQENWTDNYSIDRQKEHLKSINQYFS